MSSTPATTDPDPSKPTSGSPSAGPGRAATFDHRSSAVVRALSLFGIMPGMVVAVVLAILVGPLIGLLAVVVVAGSWALAVHLRARTSLDRLLAGLAAAPLSEAAAPRWANVVDGLGVTSGVNDVELLVLDRPEANGLAAASAERSVIVVTSGLVDALSVVEMEGVAANLLGRIKDGSARYGTTVVGLLGSFLARMEPAGRLLADGLGEQRAVQTDLAAVAMTRYPPGLAGALEHLEHLGTAVPGVDPATAHLWFAPVVVDDAGVDRAVAETVLQPMSYRVAVLREL